MCFLVLLLGAMATSAMTSASAAAAHGGPHDDVIIDEGTHGTSECASSCAPNTPGCPLTVDAARCEYMTTLVKGNLANLLGNGSAAQPAGPFISRDLPSGALSALLTQCPQPPGCCAPSAAACVQPPSPPICTAAMALLRRFGGCQSKPGAPPEDHCGSPGTSFGGQAYPLLWHAFGGSCFAAGTSARTFFLEALNASLPMTKEAATSSEVSYTNMYLMSTVNAILFGEIVGGARGNQSRDVGYAMWDAWRSYTAEAGIHEFTSPTYTYVQLTALYPGYIYAARPGARAEFGAALDLLWADLSANTFPPRGALSGPHSRDYDMLVGHGMVYLELYFWGLKGVTPLHCEYEDPHCEGPVSGSNASWHRGASSGSFPVPVGAGTGEPMTVAAVSWFNALHPMGYRPPISLRALARTPATRVIQSRFVKQTVTANGQEQQFAETYNFITPRFAMGHASQEYITNTHTKYYPNVESKLLTILLGASNATPAYGGPTATVRESPQITLIGANAGAAHIYGAEAGLRDHGMNNSHLALHIGAVQNREALLVTSALSAADAVQWRPPGSADSYTALTTNLLLPADADEWLAISAFGVSRSLDKDSATGQLTLGTVTLQLNETLCLRHGGAALAVKVLELDGVAGQVPVLQVVADKAGRRLNAARLMGQHYRSPNGSPHWINGSHNGRHARFAALVLAAPAVDSAALKSICMLTHNALTSSVTSSAGLWTVSAKTSVLPTEDITDVVTARVPVMLAVSRDLVCSRGGLRNQSVVSILTVSWPVNARWC